MLTLLHELSWHVLQDGNVVFFKAKKTTPLRCVVAKALKLYKAEGLTLLDPWAGHRCPSTCRGRQTVQLAARRNGAAAVPQEADGSILQQVLHRCRVGGIHL
jgi:hypothetical protein